jgi:hypothetical protein
VRGASALQVEVLDRHPGTEMSALVVWEPVLVSDLGPPTTSVLAKAADSRVQQFWDPNHTVGSALLRAGIERIQETEPGSALVQGGIVWDTVVLYPPGARWEESPPRPVYVGSTVVAAIEEVSRRVAAGVDSVHR